MYALNIDKDGLTVLFLCASREKIGRFIIINYNKKRKKS